MLNWSPPEDHTGGCIVAAGGKGWYTIRWQTRSGYMLTGTGHDDLPMLVLPPYGRQFDTLDKAKDFAAAIERVKATEPQISGT